MSGNINSQHINKRGEYVNWGIKWLIDHHRAKKQQRRGMVDNLNLKSGDIVLDLGCGPGLWTSLLAEKVKPTGRIVGLDSDTDFIRYASENIADQYEGIIEFHEGDFRSVPFEVDSFDLVLFGNCFAYVTDHQKVLEEQKRVTRKGGRILFLYVGNSGYWRSLSDINRGITRRSSGCKWFPLHSNPLNRSPLCSRIDTEFPQIQTPLKVHDSSGGCDLFRREERCPYDHCKDQDECASRKTERSHADASLHD